MERLILLLLHRFLAFKGLVIHLPLISLTKGPGIALLQMKQTQEECKESQDNIVRHAEDDQVCASHRRRRSTWALEY